MNNNFTKLFSSIVTSTIWREDDKTRIVWVTMLATADQYGEITASIPGLASLANVTISECESALQKLMSPDPYSRTRDQEGRRIEAVEGGWRLLNYGKYREIGQSLGRREYLRQKQREHRARQQDVNKRIQQSTLDTPANSKQKQKQKQKRKTPYSPPKGDGHSPDVLFGRFWASYPKKKAKREAEKAFHGLAPDEDLFATMLTALERQKASHDWQKEGGRYIPLPATWVNGRRWEDEVTVPALPGADAEPVVRGADGRTPRDRALAEMEIL